MRWVLFLCVAIGSFAKPLELEVSASSAILMNADTGAILFEKHPHIPSYPASITKIATALFILDHKKPALDQMVTVSGEAVKMRPAHGPYQPYWNEVEGTRMGLLKGEILSFDALLHGLMMVSGNDAANTMAEALSSTVPNFMEELNHYVLGLGCKNTHFMNPHGIHHPEHFTTAYDICLITKKALQIPKFREIVSKVSYLKPKTNKQPQAEIRQWNGLIRAGKHHYPKSIGVKTGFHSHAKNTLVGAAVHEGRTLIAVLLGCPTKGSRYQDAVRLFETAFAEKKQERCYLAMDQLFRREIEGAKTPLIARMKEDLSLSFFPSEEPTCKAFIHWGDCALPIQAGASVGEVRLLDEKGAIVKRVDLVATQEVKGTFFFNLKRKLF